ncbi:MAG: helix-turn-helix transcriptional regulator [Verrucomicrobia bacterium]|nr:helix-turn-helix transcriptional regulator [Verrucomicrobiota bacterium]
MDNMIYHLGHLPRYHSNGFSVQTIGHTLKSAPGFIRERRFASVNFSFILGGAGSAQVNAAPRVNIKAPCVITQAPGHVYSYGPEAGQTWRELFFIFPETTLAPWTDLQLFNPTEQIWSISNKAAVESRIQSLLLTLEQRDSNGMADVIDRLCELLILESRRMSPPRNLPRLHTRLYALREEIDLHPERDYDFPKLARTCGCAYSTFRRDWKILFGKPPGKYHGDRRLQEARRLLVESSLTIGEIASRLGFEDALYFSRRFHEHAGQTASDYRRINEPGGN